MELPCVAKVGDTYTAQSGAQHTPVPTSAATIPSKVDLNSLIIKINPLWVQKTYFPYNILQII